MCVQFSSATLIAQSRWQLKTLLRGQSGTENEALAGSLEGASVVLLNESVVPLSTSLNDVGRPLTIKVGPASRDVLDPSFITQTITPEKTALEPLSPVHVKAQRQAGGVNVSWVRRTRFSGDAWDASDVPLGEEQERYQLEIMSGSIIKRTLISTTQNALYTSADELSDFGASQSALSVRLCQLSTTVGEGQKTVQSIVIE